jgi:hypothetical protein
MAINPGANPSRNRALTISAAYSTEVRLTGGGNLFAGIDNFSLQAVPLIAAVWLFGSGLIELIGLARRKA